jgi:hypothetical protein
MKNIKQSKEQRRLSQLIRRKMLTKIKPSGKIYNRKNNGKNKS